MNIKINKINVPCYLLLIDVKSYVHVVQRCCIENIETKIPNYPNISHTFVDLNYAPWFWSVKSK